MSTINGKLGLKPRTKTRRATHARALVSNAQCPECASQHVVACQSKDREGELMCANGHFWKPEA